MTKSSQFWSDLLRNHLPVECAFDSEHLRPDDLGPVHRNIRVAHLFLVFGYPLPVRKGGGRNATFKALEGE